MVSDDTDHACFVAMSLASSGNSPDEFGKQRAKHLRWWLAALPAGIGFGNLRGIVKMWLGYSPANSGVWSTGNGPAMRAPLIGAYFNNDRSLRHATVRVSTRITHRDPKAEQGAKAVAAIAAWATSHFAEPNPHVALQQALSEVEDTQLRQRISYVAARLDEPTSEVMTHFNLDSAVTGYVYDTVPAVLDCWARHEGHIEPALQEMIACGGDTDTTGAIR